MQPPESWPSVQEAEEVLYGHLNRVAKTLDKLLSDIKDRSDDSGLQALVTDMNGNVKDLARVRDDLRHFMKLEHPPEVYWIESHPNFRAKSVHIQARNTHSDRKRPERHQHHRKLWLSRRRHTSQ